MLSQIFTLLPLFATALALAGEPQAAAASRLPLDGKNLAPFLLGRERKAPEA